MYTTKFGEGWSQDSQQKKIEDFYLYKDDIEDVYVFQHYQQSHQGEISAYSVVLLNSFSKKIDSVRPDSKEYSSRDDFQSAIEESITIYHAHSLSDARLFYDRFVDILEKRNHPFEHDMDSFLKPRSLDEIHVFIKSQSKYRSGIFLVGGPDGNLDATPTASTHIYQTPRGVYTAPLINAKGVYRGFQQTLAFLPFDESKALIGQEVFDYASNDLYFLRHFSENLHTYLKMDEQLEKLAKDREGAKLRYSSVKQCEPWNPQVREPMQELVGSTGYIPYTGYPVDRVEKVEPLYRSLPDHGIPQTERIKKALQIQQYQNLLDPYEIGAILHRRDPDLFQSMLDRNEQFFEMKREYNKKTNLSDTRLERVEHLPQEFGDRLGELRREGYINAQEMTIHIKDYEETMQYSSRFLTAEMLMHHHKSYHINHGRGR